MSFALARAQLVTIVAATTPTTKVQGLGSKFVHDPRADEDIAPTAPRHFWLRATAARRRGPAQLVANIAAYEVTLGVEYPLSDDRAALDAAIVADFEAITARLADQANWGRPTSTIRVIGVADSDSIFASEIVDVDGGRRLLVNVPVEVTT